MLYYSHKLLNQEKVNELATGLMSSSEWVDGKVSNMGSKLKRNLQLSNSSEQYKNYSNEIKDLLEKDEIIERAVFPAKVHSIVFSRTGGGMFYGPHLDTPYIPTGRRDLSFTLFLNEKKDYEGGELILYIPPEKKTIKLNPGEMIIYPTKYFHEVKKVTKGERMVCVGWIESLIPNNEDRESLSIFKAAMTAIEKQYGFIPALQSLSISYNNIFKSLMN